jgi:hypothetical protein
MSVLFSRLRGVSFAALCLSLTAQAQEAPIASVSADEAEEGILRAETIVV